MAKQLQEITEAPSFAELSLDNLDEEWTRHPKRVEKWAALEVEAKSEVLTAKATLDAVEAETLLNLRMTPSEYNLPDKPTELILKAAVLLQKEYKLAQKVYFRAKYKVDLCAAAMTTLEHRKRALENLVTLHGQSYFAKPTARGEAGKAKQRASDREVFGRAARD